MKPKIIIAAGCSHGSGFGNTIANEQSSEDFEHSWPNQLGKILDIPTINLSNPGQSNWSIYTNLQAEILNTIKIYGFAAQEIMVVVGWTEFSRSEYITDTVCYKFNASFAATEQFKDEPSHVQAAFKAWAMESREAQLNKFIWTYWSLSQWLWHMKIPYLMFNAITSPDIPEKDLLLSTQQDRTCSDVWTSMDWDLNYHCPFDPEETQTAWLARNFPDRRLGGEFGHWDRTALRAWAEYLAPEVECRYSIDPPPKD